MRILRSVALALAVIFLAPPLTAWRWQAPPDLAAIGFNLPSLLFTGALLTNGLTMSTNLSGPLRFGIRKYGTVIPDFIRNNPNWSLALLFSFVFLPFTHIVFLTAVPVAWQYVRERHNEAVEDVLIQVEECCVRASTAMANAKEDAKTAEGDARQAREVAAVAVRDGRLARSLRATDFFNQSSQAWVPLQKVVEAARAATEEARNATFSAEELEDMAQGDDDEDDDDSDGGDVVGESGGGAGKVAVIQRKLEELLVSTERAEDAAQTAQKRTAECVDARTQVDRMRTSEQDNAREVAVAFKGASTAATEASAAARSALEQADETRRFATAAKAEARKGDVDKAKDFVALARKATEAAKSYAATARIARNTARERVNAVIRS